jgi:hypothetical protein
LVGFGLAITDVSGVPDPRVHAERLLDRSQTSTTIDRDETATRFIEARTKPGDTVLVLRENGHLVARRARVHNVGTIGHPFHVISGSQLEGELERLREAGGGALFTQGAYLLSRSFTDALAAEGWERATSDNDANISEWVRADD